MKDDSVNNKNSQSSKVGYTLLDWFKFITGLLFVGVIAFKLALSDLSFDFSKFDFSSLLALILSLFAIGLSVAFYFKATDTSNLFYDNTYKFTKEISEILGRIEAGFGERLRHLDEGYSGLITKFDNGFQEQNIKETKEEIEKEKEKLEHEIRERNEILNTLIENAQLEKDEKEKIRQQLKEKEIEISKQNREINFLRNRLSSENENEGIYDIRQLPQPVLNSLTKYAKRHGLEFLKRPSSVISQHYKMDIKDLREIEVKYLLKYSIINEDGTFTLYGIRLLKHLAEKLTSQTIG